MNFQDLPSTDRPASLGSWGYHSLSNTPSPTNFSDTVASWNGGGKALARHSNKKSSSASSTPGLAFSSAGASAGSSATYQRRRDNPAMSMISTRCSSISGGFYLGDSQGAKDNNTSTNFQTTSPPTGSKLSTAVSEGSFNVGGKEPNSSADNSSKNSGGARRTRKKSNTNKSPIDSAGSSSSTSESPSTVGGPLGPPRVRKNPFFRTLNMGGSYGPNALLRDAEEILKNSPNVRPQTGWTPYKALPAIGCSTANFKQQAERPETIVDCDYSRSGSPEIDDSMPFPDDIKNFGYDEEDPDPDEDYIHQSRLNGQAPNRERFLVQVESNLVPDELLVPEKHLLVRRRTFEIIEPVDDDLERPVVDDDTYDAFSESENDKVDDGWDEDPDDQQADDQDSDDFQLRVNLSDTDLPISGGKGASDDENRDDAAAAEEGSKEHQDPSFGSQRNDKPPEPLNNDERPLLLS